MLGGGGDADTKRLGTLALTQQLEVLIGLYLTTLDCFLTYQMAFYE